MLSAIMPKSFGIFLLEIRRNGSVRLRNYCYLKFTFQSSPGILERRQEMPLFGYLEERKSSNLFQLHHDPLYRVLFANVRAV